MTWKDVVFVGDHYIKPNDLSIGDLFMEDTYPEVYRVVRYGNISGLGRVVIAVDTETNTESTWGGRGAYAPCLNRVEAKTNQNRVEAKTNQI